VSVWTLTSGGDSKPGTDLLDARRLARLSMVIDLVPI
jgi:hypothetical protein